MKTIYKYELKIAEFQTIEMPFNAEILSVQTQNDAPCIWAKVDPDLPIEKVKFIMLWTGRSVKEDFEGCYIGTCQIFGGGIVYHIFKL